MRNLSFIWIVVAIMLVLEIYVFQAIKMVLPVNSPRLRMSIIVIYWLVAILMVAILFVLPYVNYEAWPRPVRIYIFSVIVAAFFSMVIASLFLAVDDLRRGATWLIVKMFRNPAQEVEAGSESITRSAFITWLGLAFGGGLFTTMLYGFSNKYNYTVKKLNLGFNNLPESFKGTKIVHISDIHCGSFMNKEAVQRGIDKIIKENPDLILFTGDLVNDRAVEMAEYLDVFNQLKAPLGVYSTLGNHDYGDYYHWPSLEEKTENLRQLKEIHNQLGWRLLLNENIILEKNNQQVALIGVENWSAKGNFSRYGSMEKAYPGAEKTPFKILMSHDPSHWDGEIRRNYNDIDLMLSGHTHGMQFGVELPNFRWSPVQYMYKQWAGLYEEENQKLYVNRGFGFIGYPGRVGILPEITVITLT
jgi:hypothetical protein